MDRASLVAPITWMLAGAWVVLLELLLLHAIRSRESRHQKIGLAGLFAASTILHAVLTSRGPGDLRLSLLPIYSVDLDTRWGPAPIALFGMLGDLSGGVHDTGIIACNLALSGLVPVLLYGIARTLGVSPGPSLLAAGLAAAHPLLICFSGTLGREPAYLVAALGSFLGLCLYLRSGGWRPAVIFCIGTVLAVLSRPEGAHVLVFDLACLAVVRPEDGRRRWRAATMIGAIGCLTVVYTRHLLQLSMSVNEPNWRLPWTTVFRTVLFQRDFVPAAWIALFVLGLLLRLRRAAARVTVLSLLLLDLTWRWAGLYGMFVGYRAQVASSRYEVILLLPFTLGTALGFSWLLALQTRLRAVALLAFAGATLGTYGLPAATLLRGFTVDSEYRFLRAHLRDLPGKPTVYAFDAPVSDIGFIDAAWAPRFFDDRVNVAFLNEGACPGVPELPENTYVYIGSSCAPLLNDARRPLPQPRYDRWLDACRILRQTVQSGAVAEETVPARKMSWHEFKDSTVKIGLYALTSRPPCGQLYPGGG